MKNWSHNAQRWTVPRVCQRESLKMQRKERWFRDNFSPPFLWAFPWIAPNHTTSPGGIRPCLLSLCQTLCVYQLENRKDFPCLPCKSEKCLLIPRPSISLTCHAHAAKSSSPVLSGMITAKSLIKCISSIINPTSSSVSLKEETFESFFFPLQNSPPSIFLAETDTGISKGGKISGYILKLYFF